MHLGSGWILASLNGKNSLSWLFLRGSFSTAVRQSSPKQIYDTYIAIDWALSKGHVQGEAEAQAYAFVVDQLHRLIDRNALRMIGENLAEDVDDVELVADFSGFKGD